MDDGDQRHQEAGDVVADEGDLDWSGSTIRVVYGKGQKERQIPFDHRCQKPMLRYLGHLKIR